MSGELMKKDSGSVVSAPTPSTLLEMAIQQGADLDKLEKLMDLQQRWEKNEARKAYVAAMTRFKSDPPKINKDRHVKYGNTEYDHASLANVVEKITKALSEVGITHAWSTENKQGIIHVTCTLTHEGGHSESVTLWGEPDKSGAKNAIQAVGSTVSYLQRYTLLAITGLATQDMDDDGIASQPIELIDEHQIADLYDFIADVNADMAKFLSFFKIAKLEDLPASRFREAEAMLEAKRRQS